MAFKPLRLSLGCSAFCQAPAFGSAVHGAILRRRLRRFLARFGFAGAAQVDDVPHQAGTAMRIARRASFTVTGVSARISPSIEIGSGGSVSSRNSFPRYSRTVPRT